VAADCCQQRDLFRIVYMAAILITSLPTLLHMILRWWLSDRLPCSAVGGGGLAAAARHCAK
jgi:hypothetical protein